MLPRLRHLLLIASLSCAHTVAAADYSFEPRRSGGATPEFGVGFGVGSFDVVTLRVERFDIGVGIDDFGVTLDYRLSNQLVTNSPSLDWLYLFVGGIYNADADEGYRGRPGEKEPDEFGLRAGVGAHVFFNQLELFAQVMPTLYLIEDTDLDGEGLIGARLWF